MCGGKKHNHDPFVLRSSQALVAIEAVGLIIVLVLVIWLVSAHAVWLWIFAWIGLPWWVSHILGFIGAISITANCCDSPQGGINCWFGLSLGAAISSLLGTFLVLTITGPETFVGPTLFSNEVIGYNPCDPSEDDDYNTYYSCEGTTSKPFLIEEDCEALGFAWHDCRCDYNPTDILEYNSIGFLDQDGEVVDDHDAKFCDIVDGMGGHSATSTCLSFDGWCYDDRYIALVSMDKLTSDLNTVEPDYTVVKFEEDYESQESCEALGGTWTSWDNGNDDMDEDMCYLRRAWVCLWILAIPYSIIVSIIRIVLISKACCCTELVGDEDDES